MTSVDCSLLAENLTELPSKRRRWREREGTTEKYLEKAKKKEREQGDAGLRSDGAPFISEAR